MSKIKAGIANVKVVLTDARPANRTIGRLSAVNALMDMLETLRPRDAIQKNQSLFLLAKTATITTFSCKIALSAQPDANNVTSTCLRSALSAVFAQMGISSRVLPARKSAQSANITQAL
jgi:hypothetical protein